MSICIAACMKCSQWVVLHHLVATSRNLAVLHRTVPLAAILLWPTTGYHASAWPTASCSLPRWLILSITLTSWEETNTTEFCLDLALVSANSILESCSLPLDHSGWLVTCSLSLQNTRYTTSDDTQSWSRLWIANTADRDTCTFQSLPVYQSLFRPYPHSTFRPSTPGKVRQLLPLCFSPNCRLHTAHFSVNVDRNNKRFPGGYNIGFSVTRLLLQS